MNKIITSFVIGSLVAIANQQVSSDEIEIPFRYARGNLLFKENCSSCHGLEMTGTDKGPPLLHAFYKPSHHDDASFYRAGINGVRAHHWNFGDMPPVEGMTVAKMNSIVPYIRFFQQKNKLY